MAGCRKECSAAIMRRTPACGEGERVGWGGVGWGASWCLGGGGHTCTSWRAGYVAGGARSKPAVRKKASLARQGRQPPRAAAAGLARWARPPPSLHCWPAGAQRQRSAVWGRVPVGRSTPGAPDGASCYAAAPPLARPALPPKTRHGAGSAEQSRACRTPRPASRVERKGWRGQGAVFNRTGLAAVTKRGATAQCSSRRASARCRPAYGRQRRGTRGPPRRPTCLVHST
jgi:hypothetical protein